MFMEDEEAASPSSGFKRNTGSKLSLDVLTSNSESGAVALRSSKPIANLFPETTIFFADLAGFTAFSATRTPVEVFTLLETIYNAFDGAAKRRRVFKVETVSIWLVCRFFTKVHQVASQRNHFSLMLRTDWRLLRGSYWLATETKRSCY